LTQFHEFGTNLRIVAIGVNQLAKPAWLLPAFNLQYLRAGRGEERGRGADSSDPPRFVPLRFFHDGVLISRRRFLSAVLPKTK
jgi:hypothetical protein